MSMLKRVNHECVESFKRALSLIVATYQIFLVSSSSFFDTKATFKMENFKQIMENIDSYMSMLIEAVKSNELSEGQFIVKNTTSRSKSKSISFVRFHHFPSDMPFIVSLTIYITMTHLDSCSLL